MDTTQGSAPAESARPVRGRPRGTRPPESDAVKRVRAALGVNQTEMAAQLGCSFSSVQRMERLGRLPNVAATRRVLERMAKRAGVMLDEVTP